MQSRTLSAIMSADIVGYTALMQYNEDEGLRKVKRFREVLEENVKQKGGKIVQYYGDGCLVTFSSGILALQCAMDNQESLMSKENTTGVPLRIGIHIGDKNEIESKTR